jgi:hypothetical protein
VTARTPGAKELGTFRRVLTERLHLELFAEDREIPAGAVDGLQVKLNGMEAVARNAPSVK